MGRERTNSSEETVEKGQLRSDGECENVTSPFVILGITGFGDSWGEVQGTTAAGREENQHVYFQGYQHDRGPTGSLKCTVGEGGDMKPHILERSWPEM